MKENTRELAEKIRSNIDFLKNNILSREKVEEIRIENQNIQNELNLRFSEQSYKTNRNLSIIMIVLSIIVSISSVFVIIDFFTRNMN